MQMFVPRTGQYTFRADSQAIAQARHAVVGFAREHGVPDERLHGIALAVSEACTNAVLHAYRDGAPSGSISVALELMAWSLRIQVRDDGVGMRPRADSPGLGLGLPIIGRMADGFAVEPGPRGGTELCMRFDLAPPLAA
jgi:serine/threonine-protein kinase RsbW